MPSCTGWKTAGQTPQRPSARQLSLRMTAATTVHPAMQHEDRHVPQEDLLRLLAQIVPVHEQQVAENSEDDERNRDHHRLRGTCGERVEAVRDDGRCRDDGDELVDERERVALQDGPPGRRLRADEHELAAPLCERQEEGEQRRAEEEPGRDSHLDRRRSRRGPDDEQTGDAHDVEQHDVLELQRVRRLQREEGAQAEDRGEPERRDEEDGREDQHHGDQLGQAW